MIRHGVCSLTQRGSGVHPQGLQPAENLVEMLEVSELRSWHIPNRNSRIASASDFGSASSNGAMDDAE